MRHDFCFQPFFALYFSAWEISRRFSTRAHTLYGSAYPFHSLFLYPLHLSFSFSLSLFLSLSLSLLSLPLSLYLSFYLSLSLSPSLSLLSIILFGVSNGRFRPCFLLNYTLPILMLDVYWAVSLLGFSCNRKKPFPKCTFSLAVKRYKR